MHLSVVALFIFPGREKDRLEVKNVQYTGQVLPEETIRVFAAAELAA
jgi:hypothetical protein